MRRILTAAALAFTVPMTGCWILENAAEHGAERAADNTANNVADDATRRNESQAQPSSSANANANANADAQREAAMASMGPMMTRMYTQLMFSMAFSAGGYAPEETDYKPGQYTRWVNNSNKSTLERAYLFDDADKNKWWKVKFVDEKGQTVIMEALFNPDRTKLLRLRAKFPNDTAGKEIPVEDNTYYTAPRHLTAQSLKGADQGVESVSVPAGSFSAHHYVFGDVQGSAEFWTTDKVPGGTVKQAHKASSGDDKRSYELVLTAYGDGAQSELGTKP